MKSVKELRRKAAARTRRKAQVYSTSEARANFAEALENAQVENAVIGFDRYGRTVAALVPVEAIYMLAGMGHMISPGVREEIANGSQQFVHNVPNRVAMREPEPPKAKAKAKGATKKSKSKKKGKRAKARG
jgi:hypothetical protein